MTKVINEGKTPLTVTGRFFSATGTGAQPGDTSRAGSTKLDGGHSLDSLLEMDNNSRFVEGIASLVSRPYFTRGNVDQAYYDIINPALRLAPETPAVSFWARFSYREVSLLLGHVVSAPKSAPAQIEVPVQAVPSMSVSIDPANGAIPLPATTFPVKVDVRSTTDQALQGYVHLVVAKWMEICAAECGICASAFE